MERGVNVLVRILAGALILGGLVIVFHPDYRETWKALWRGDVESSPIWQSNADYYREVFFDLPGSDASSN
ncbi:MAG TPA: hypothetical protein PKE26_13955 [Kiritimatiellia bacterium]|nr:hypothetical protein [Kiritimatiellia bacterium]HMP00207.1 hypothetical protein [Kiritimatiellia bacterium]HMP96837.1 hypothetical protein [Kiritimatiellia bacterium]